MTNISPKQKEILMFLKEYISLRGESPTLEEIARNVEIGSRAGVHYHLKVLEQRGLIKKEKGVYRRLVDLVDELDFASVPLLGVANAGQPLASSVEERLGIIKIDSNVLKNNGNLFAVRLQGDSMNKQYIPNRKSPYATVLDDNNIAIIDKNAEIEDGDVVLAIINGGATVKVFKRTENSIVLMPNSSNSKHQPIFIFDEEDAFFNGKVVFALSVPT